LRSEAGGSSSSNCGRIGTDACKVTHKLRMASDDIRWNSGLSTASGTAVVVVGIGALAAHQQFERIEPFSDFVSLKKQLV
jgi:predicted neutral ceramidase superfamily lipid hydrolase